MFSPSQQQKNGPAMATRSRRRQRPLSADNSLSMQPKAKRPRLPLTEQAFSIPEVAPEMLEAKHSKPARARSSAVDNENAREAPKAHRKQLSVRSKKPKAGDRVNKGDGGVVLANTNAYTVSKLPALPDRVRADASSPQQGSLNASTGYGICVNHTHVSVWPYNAVNASPETFVFTLPYPSKRSADPLPLATLIPPSTANDEPGLLVVMPLSGSVTYWEHISSAATLDFMGQHRSGIEDNVGLSHADVILQLETVGTTGAVIASNSGKVGYIAVRDAQGKPCISTRILDGSMVTVQGGGFFGSIRHALKQAVYRGSLVAIHANTSESLGLTRIVAATQTGRFQAWNIHRGGHYQTIANTDARQSMVTALANILPSADASLDFEVVDFAFVPGGIEESYSTASALALASPETDDAPVHLVALVALTGHRQTQYAIVEMTLRHDVADIGVIRTVSSYAHPINQATPEKPRIYLPRPGLVAFVVFDHAVVIASLAANLDILQSQIQQENHLLPGSFEDVIDLQESSKFEIVGSGIEEPAGYDYEADAFRNTRPRPKNPTLQLLVRGVGVVRVALADVERFASEKPPVITAKDKLEQAVFFGTRDDNPLVFDGLRDFQFTDQEMESAAMSLSFEIMDSTAQHLPTLPASMEHNLRQRSSFLERITSTLKIQKFALSDEARWTLLFNAEKMEMAAKVWSLHEVFLSERAEDEKKTLVSEVIEFIHEEDKSALNRSAGEIDRTRHWFLRDVGRMDVFLLWCFSMLRELHKGQHTDDPTLTRYLYEAVVVEFEVEHGAMAFRSRNIDFYGLTGVALQHAVPKPWTSTGKVVSHFKRLVELCHKWLGTYYPPQVKAGSPDPGLIELIRERLPDLTEQYLVCLSESLLINETSEDAIPVNGESVRATIDNNKNIKIMMLRDLGLTEQALAIAERHDAFEAMAELAVQQILDCDEEASSTRPTSRADIHESRIRQDQAEHRLLAYFDKFGEKLAFVAYQLLLRYGGVQMVSQIGVHDRNGYFTDFLRADPNLRRIAWINEVEVARNIDKAADTLTALGLQEGEQLWSKKVELSLGKLALIAGASTSVETTNPPAGIQIGRVENELDLIRIQDHVYSIVQPFTAHAVDEEASLKLAMDALAPRDSLPKKQHVLIKIVENALIKLLNRQALTAVELVDLLTLARFDSPEDYDTQEEPFFMALCVADLGMQGDEQYLARCLIWRRAYNRDDWANINHTEDLDDLTIVDALSRTQPYFTALAWAANRHSAGKQMEDWLVRPSDALGVYTQGDLPRSHTADDLIDKLKEAMKWEDSNLRKNLEKNQLAKWTAAALQIGEQNVVLQLDKATSTGNGHANGNGHVTNGVH